MKRTRLSKLLSLLLTLALLLPSLPAMAVDLGTVCQQHDWKVMETINPGMCGEEIVTYRYCDICGISDVVRKVIQHKFGDWKVVRNATCAQEGLKQRKCSVCGKIEEQKIGVTAHSWSGWKVEREATCAGSGKKSRKCSVCGATQTERIERRAHKWGEWELVTPPGEFSVGQERRVCSVCGLEQWRDVYPEGMLQRGDHGDEVKALQEALNDAGYDCGEEDGVFGPKTEKAVQDYQEDNGLQGDGIAWPGVIAGLEGDDLSDDGVAWPGTTPGSEDTDEPDDPASAFELYILSNITPIPAVAGDEVVINLGVKNVGEALLTLNMHEVLDKDGNSRSPIDTITGEWPLALSQFAPGETESFKLSIKVTEQDVLNGNATRTYVQYGKTWCWDDNGTLRPARVGDIGKSDYLTTREDVLYDLSESVTIVIPLITSGEVILTKGTLDEPSNGDFYVEGEEITYMIMLENRSDNAITDVEIVDPLKGGNEDAVLTLGETVNSGETKEWEFTYTVTAQDVERGYIDNTASATYVMNNDYFDLSSNTVTVPTRGEPEEYALQLELIEFADAAYAPNEALPGKLRVTNTGAKPLYLYAYRISSGDASTMFDTITGFETMTTLLHPEQSAEFDFIIYASESDFTVFNEVIRHICMYGVPCLANGASDMETKVESNTLEVKAPAYYEVPETMVSIAKEVVSAPANDAYYVEGETIRYQISFTNNSEEELNGVLIFDVLDESGEATGIAHQFMPGEERSINFEYTVTAFDVAIGKVVNYAVLTYPQGENTVEVVSNIVTSLTGESAFGVIEELFVDKKEVSTPANGSYYQEGETISYEITYTNVGEVMLGETIIYDSLAPTDIGYAEHLYPGEERSVTFNYEVTAKDVEAGCVANHAMAGYDVGGFYRTAHSNEVCSPTSAEMRTEAPACEITLPVLSGGEDFCVRTLEERANAENVFKLHYCSAHEATLQAVNAMVGVAATAQARAAAWEYGISLWQSEIAAMYASLMEAANSPAKVIVLSEQLRFNALVVNRKAMLDKLYPDTPERVAEMIAGMYAEQCLELCYALHAAPEDRADDLLLLPCGEGTTDACATTHTPVDSANFIVHECLCESHKTTNVMAETLLANGGTEEAWNWVETIWNAEMTKEYKALKARTAEENVELIVIDARTYGEWIDARRALVQLLYPEKNEIAAQLSAKAVINRVRELCAEK